MRKLVLLLALWLPALSHGDVKSYIGFVPLPSATGAQDVTVTGVPFQPKFVVMLTTLQQAAGGSTRGIQAFCFAVPAGERTIYYDALDDFVFGGFAAGGTSGCGPTTFAGLDGWTVGVTSFTADGFVLHFSSYPVDNHLTRFAFLAIGGSSITQAIPFNAGYTDNVLGDASHSDSSGAAPIFLFGSDMAGGTNRSSSGIWFADGTASIYAGTQAEFTTTPADVNAARKLLDNGTYLNTIDPLTNHASDPVVEQWNVTFKNFFNAGYTDTVNTTFTSGGSCCFVFAVEGTAKVKAGSFTSAGTGIENVPLGLTPKAAIVVSMDTPNQSWAFTWKQSIGFTDGTTNVGSWISVLDTANPSAAGRAWSETNAAIFLTTSANVNPPNLNAQAGLSFSGTNLRFTWNTADSVTRKIGYVVFGEAPPATVRHRVRWVN